MRNLTFEEITKYIDDDVENLQELGDVPVETTLGELFSIKASTLCGLNKNHAFGDKRLIQYSNILVWCIYNSDDNEVIGRSGMVHIKCDEQTAEKISEIICLAGGSLRLNGKSLIPDFYEFEIE